MKQKTNEEIEALRESFYKEYYPEWYLMHTRIQDLLKQKGIPFSIEFALLPSEKGVESYCEDLKPTERGAFFMSSGALNPRVGVFRKPEVVDAIDKSYKNGWDLTFIFGNGIMLNDEGHNLFYDYLIQNSNWKNFTLRLYKSDKKKTGLPFHAKIVKGTDRQKIVYEYPHKERRLLRKRIVFNFDADIYRLICDYYKPTPKNSSLDYSIENIETLESLTNIPRLHIDQF